MIKRSRSAAFAVITAALFLSCNNSSNSGNKKSSSSHDVPLGMKFENRDKLAGIPLASTPFGGNELPSSFDMSSKMPPVGNQGQQNSCVAWAIAYALKSYQEKVELGKQIMFSPSYIYNQINNGMNVPTYVTDALNILSEQGVCPMDDMPYQEGDYTSKPSEAARQDAKKFRIDFWRQVNVSDNKEVKAQLSAGYPVIIGADVSKEFVDDGFAQKEAFIWKDAGTPSGGHCMLLVGYDDSKSAFKVMNSWGQEWGDHGFSWIDYNLFPNVVKYGFVAKDAFTENPGTPNEYTTDNNTNNNNQTEYTNTKDNSDQYQVQNNDPTQFEENIAFESNDVEHNVKNESDPDVGFNMKIKGTVDIPAAYGKKFQIVVHIYSKSTNRQVKSLRYPTYADVNGFAAGCTPVYDITSKGFRNGTWWIDIPYSAIDMPRGERSYFYAVPTLFVDNFGIAYGDKIEFYVDNP